MDLGRPAAVPAAASAQPTKVVRLWQPCATNGHILATLSKEWGVTQDPGKVVL
jgi:hypothetical protein